MGKFWTEMVQKMVQVKGPKFDGMLDRFWSIWGAHLESNSVPKRVQNGIQIEVEKRRVTKTLKKVVTPLRGRLREGSGKAEGNPREGSRKAQGRLKAEPGPP